MGSLEVVVAEPAREVGGTGLGSAVRQSVSPFAQQGLNEPLGLAVGLGCVGPGADVAQAQHPAGLTKAARDITRAVVGHHALDPNAETLEPAQRPDEEAVDRLALLVRQDLDEGEPGSVVNRHVDELPASTLALGAPIAGDPMADAPEAGELLDIEVDSSPARARL